ncbi:MAG: hypothetical protein A2W42_04760 [Candidatus Muproteobacteria bacterium RIFCSPHIGHO2_01_60_12]|nr:MAG: hypothetical protein A2W42_04760 [Candidatus Muproteobacteria bacterium RIFCSPHIGHO2_01_60_12]
MYIGDVVEASIKAATLGVSVGDVFNVATGRAVTLNELLRVLCRLCDMPFARLWAGAPRRYSLVMRHRRQGAGIAGLVGQGGARSGVAEIIGRVHNQDGCCALRQAD